MHTAYAKRKQVQRPQDRRQEPPVLQEQRAEWQEIRLEK